MYILFL